METQLETGGLAAALFGKTRRRVLAFLFNRAERTFYTREIARATKTALGAVHRELTRLARAGIVNRSIRGSQVHYQANAGCPIYVDLCALMIKSVGVADVVRAGLTKLAPRIDFAFLYGSLARGQATPASDVDVLVVGKVYFTEVVAVLAPLQERLGREVNPSVYPTEEFRRKLRAGHHFLTAVLCEPKVLLVGDQHELDRLAESGLAHRRN
jgi:uncharacterized protein